MSRVKTPPADPKLDAILEKIDSMAYDADWEKADIKSLKDAIVAIAAPPAPPPVNVIPIISAGSSLAGYASASKVTNRPEYLEGLVDEINAWNAAIGDPIRVRFNMVTEGINMVRSHA